MTGSSGCGKLLSEIFGSTALACCSLLISLVPLTTAWVPSGTGAGWDGCLGAPGVRWDQSSWAEQRERCMTLGHVGELRGWKNGCCVDRS